MVPVPFSGSQSLHPIVTSFFESLHTKGKRSLHSSVLHTMRHFIQRVTSYRSLHTIHSIPIHFILKSLHPRHFILVVSYQPLQTYSWENYISGCILEIDIFSEFTLPIVHRQKIVLIKNQRIRYAYCTLKAIPYSLYV